MKRLDQQFQAIETHYPCAWRELPSRVRLGLVQLATDHTLENDWHLLAGNRIELYSTRLPFGSHMGPDELRAMGDDIASAAALLAPGMPLDVLAYGCTSGSLMIGDGKVSKELTRARPGLPTTNPLRACKAALRHLGVQRMALLTPYTSEVNRPLHHDLVHSGFEVTALGAFDLVTDTEVAMIDRASIEQAVAGMLARGRADALFLSCTNLPVIHLLQELEEGFGIPMLSSNQVMFWHALRLAGSSLTFDGFGRLLATS
ncbi:MAG: aspartate/glutamate racemase family protein [Sedimenticola sp.]|nr:aspartate/glutamate racemase family protein [Sedimenticola sp.]